MWLNLSCYYGIIFYDAGHEFGMYSQPSEEVPNPDIERFYSLLKIVNKSLWEGYMHSQLFFTVKILSNKSKVS